MAEIVFLGTSCAVPTAERNHPAIHFRHRDQRFLFDCGENVQRQLAIAKLSPMKINAVFITHLHGDHYFGLAGLIQSSYWRERKEPIRIFGPRGIAGLVGNIRKTLEEGDSFEIAVQEVESGTALEGDGFSVSAFPVGHNVPAVGYAFQEGERAHANEKKLRKLGLAPGKEYGLLKEGKPVLFNGKKLLPKDYVTKERGVKFVYTGDTGPSESVIKSAEGADLLVHEATFARDMEARARETGHSTARDAGIVAREANVKQLALVHFSTRYKEKDLEKLLIDAKREFENVVIARDFMRIEI